MITSSPSHFNAPSPGHPNNIDMDSRTSSIVKLNSEYEDEITIVPNYELEATSKSPISRRKQKSLKFMNRYHHRVSNKTAHHTGSSAFSPVSNNSNGSNMVTIDCLKLTPNLKLRGCENKVTRTPKSKINIRGAIKSKRRIATSVEKLINNFYSQVTHPNIQLLAPGKAEKNKDILSLFKTEGKGAVIEVENNPIFPLKLTIEYLQSRYAKCQFMPKNINVECIGPCDLARPAFKEAQNSNQLSNMGNMDIEMLAQNVKTSEYSPATANSQVLIATVDGQVKFKDGTSQSMQHIFNINQNKITRLNMCS